MDDRRSNASQGASSASPGTSTSAPEIPEDLLDGTVEAMDLIDEQDVAIIERREDRGEVAGAFDGRAGCVPDIHAELTGDDRGERRLAEARRAVKEDVVGRLSPALGSPEEHGEVRLDLCLADVFAQRLEPQRTLDDGVIRLFGIGGQDAHARQVVDHRARW